MVRAKELKKKNKLFTRRKLKVASKIRGCKELPRIVVHKSNKNFYIQAINDDTQATLCSLHSKKSGVKVNKDGAKAIAADFAAVLKDKKITVAVFDKSGYKYHGVIASFVDGIRENGIKI